jgi:hypothetical protein
VDCDAEPWQRARSIRDLGELRARWLEGALRWSPRYYGAGPDSETSPLVPILAEINRLGFWTTMSQPGLVDGTIAQRANVSGYCTEATANTIQAGLLATDLLVVALPADMAGDSALRVPITRNGMSEFTWAGAFEDVDEWRDELDPEVVDVIASAWAIDIIDLAWGRDDLLWPTLLTALRSRPQRHVASYLADVWTSSAGLIFTDN